MKFPSFLRTRLYEDLYRAYVRRETAATGHKAAFAGYRGNIQRSSVEDIDLYIDKLKRELRQLGGLASQQGGGEISNH